MSDKQDRQHEEKIDAGELNRNVIRQKNEENDGAEPSEAARKWGNFWYYNKWKVIVGLGILLVVIFCTVQMCGKAEDDVVILYGGSDYLVSDQILTLQNTLSLYLPEDFNGDGDKRAALSNVSVYSPEQVESINLLAASDSRYSTVNTMVNQENLTHFNMLILTGEYNVCMMEPWLYKNVAQEGGLRKLSDVLGGAPENAYSEYAVLLSETAVYRDNPGLFDGFAEDTLLCLRIRSAISGLNKSRDNAAAYENEEAFFRALVLGIPEN